MCVTRAKACLGLCGAWHLSATSAASNLTDIAPKGPQKNYVYFFVAILCYFLNPGPVPEASWGLDIEFPVKNAWFGCVIAEIRSFSSFLMLKPYFFIFLRHFLQFLAVSGATFDTFWQFFSGRIYNDFTQNSKHLPRGPFHAPGMLFSDSLHFSHLVGWIFVDFRPIWAVFVHFLVFVQPRFPRFLKTYRTAQGLQTTHTTP